MVSETEDNLGKKSKHQTQRSRPHPGRLSVHSARLWEATKPSGGQLKAWKVIATKLHEENNVFQRSATLCWSQFDKLLNDFETDEEDELGEGDELEQLDAADTENTADEVDKYTKLLIDIAKWWRESKKQQAEAVTATKEKMLAEEAGGKQLWFAALEGVVPCEQLVDVTRIEGSSHQEKMAQQTKCN
ncbi:hypothetical protein FRC07_003458 [Ceratobasidium sp. 392]|nr:hypothetical protein FRC07_003458 [Ceratobasidium sp. 392]